MRISDWSSDVCSSDLHMLDLARADPERERPQRAVRRGVTVAAYQRGARQREAQFGADDMDDALFGRGRVDIVAAEFGGVAIESGQIVGALGVGKRQAVACSVDPRGGGQSWAVYRQRQ